jgi:hypothetical protein
MRASPVQAIGHERKKRTKTNCESLHDSNMGLGSLGETLWLRPDMREQVGSTARLIEKGVVCWLHVFRGLLLARPIRMFGEGRAVPAGRTK